MTHPAPDHDTAKRRNQLVLEYLKVRRALGGLGVLLPAALLVYAALPAGAMQPSISEFYYTHMGGFLVGCLCAIGVFLASYKGYPRDPARGEWLSDRVLTLAAGLGAFGVALFPVRNPATPNLCTDPITVGLECHAGLLHFGSAALFLVAIALMSIFQFTRKDRGPMPGNRILWTSHNILYVACGAVMLAAIGVLGLVAMVPAIKSFAGRVNLIFWAETVAVLAFATAWLVKSKSLDRPLAALSRLGAQAGR